MDINEQTFTKKSIKEIRAETKKIKDDGETLRLANLRVGTENYYYTEYKEKCIQQQQQLEEQQKLILSLQQQLDQFTKEKIFTEQCVQTEEPDHKNDHIKQVTINRIQMQQAKLQLQKERGTQLVITNKNIRILELEQQIQEQLNELIQEKITLNKTIEELEKTQITPQTSPQAQVKFKEPLEEISEIKEQHTYTDMEKKINVQRYMRYGGKRQLYNLSKILLEIMQNENVENIDTKFGQVYDFWESAQKEVTKEWFMKQNSVQLKVNYMFCNNGNVQSRSAKYTHKQIPAQIVDGVPVLIGKEEDKKQRKKEEQMLKKQMKEQMKENLKEKNRQRGKVGVK
ncbi:Hypothetical_protein [Hexamita inflata]|uniref:Hypothetical_protein n=1 Tax=Hexamita inflata TaxID=28002 RepID=A0AA86UHR0_9EUKA|nr:Hypothetical protein HINF_LOCUS46305 [Hexamita inflata]